MIMSLLLYFLTTSPGPECDYSQEAARVEEMLKFRRLSKEMKEYLLYKKGK